MFSPLLGRGQVQSRLVLLDEFNFANVSSGLTTYNFQQVNLSDVRIATKGLAQGPSLLLVASAFNVLLKANGHALQNGGLSLSSDPNVRLTSNYDFVDCMAAVIAGLALLALFHHHVTSI